MMNTKAIRVDFCGADGSGKTTSLKYFIEQLRFKGLRVLETREVGNPHVQACVKLREFVLNPENNLSGAAMEFIFAAMRIENEKFYKSVEGEYDYIISDRGWFSHLAYTDHNVSPEFTELFYTKVVGLLTGRPDQVIFLNCLPEVALARRTLRNGFVDAIEAKGPRYQELVYKSFIEHFNANRTIPVAHIDANGDIASVRAQLDSLIQVIDGLAVI